MKAALPLVRSVGHAVIPSTSRIPHLEYHILRRSRPKLESRQRCKRHSSSTVDLNAYSQSLFDASSEATTNSTIKNDQQSRPSASNKIRSQNSVDFAANQIVHQTASQSSSFVDLGDFVEDLSGHELLNEACPERLLAWLTAHPTGQAFINTASNVDFERALFALDPAVLVDPFKQLQKDFNGAKLNDYDFQYNRSLVTRLRAFTQAVDHILAQRQNSGLPLTLNACRHALRCAAAAGDIRVADNIFNLMPLNSIDPDLSCYNSLMHAHVWNLAYTEHARRSFRVFPRNVNLRSQVWRPKNVLGYRVSEKLPDAAWTLRSTVLESFRHISEKAWDTNEETFTNLILGLARSGDVPGVESILKSVWNIDVDALNSFDEEEIQSPTYYADDHHLRPTHRLLFAIVHAYSVNSDMEKARSILDYTSRNYALDIPEYVWEELLEWTFVMSKARQKKSRKQGQDQGQIRPEEVEVLYNRLLDEPYNVQPTFSMLKILAKSYRNQRRLLTKSLSTIRQLDTNLRKQLDRLRLMVETCKTTILSQSPGVDIGLPSRDVVEFCRDFQQTFLSTMAQHGFLLREFNRILTETNWPGSGKQQDWQRRWLPEAIEEFKSYLPECFRYQTKTGEVYFSTPSNLRTQDSMRRLLAEAAVIFQAIATTDLLQVQQNLNSLAHDFESATVLQMRTNLEHENTEGSTQDVGLQTVKSNKLAQRAARNERASLKIIRHDARPAHPAAAGARRRNRLNTSGQQSQAVPTPPSRLE